MDKELTTSLVARTNVLNNAFALEQLAENLELGGTAFEGQRLPNSQNRCVT